MPHFNILKENNEAFAPKADFDLSKLSNEELESLKNLQNEAWLRVESPIDEKKARKGALRGRWLLGRKPPA